MLSAPCLPWPEQATSCGGPLLLSWLHSAAALDTGSPVVMSRMGPMPSNVSTACSAQHAWSVPSCPSLLLLQHCRHYQTAAVSGKHDRSRLLPMHTNDHKEPPCNDHYLKCKLGILGSIRFLLPLSLLLFVLPVRVLAAQPKSIHCLQAGPFVGASPLARGTPLLRALHTGQAVTDLRDCGIQLTC